MYLKFADYDKETKISTVQIKHMGKVFTAYSKLIEEDLPHESKFTGCRFAEKKAIIKALKYEYKIKKEKCKECENFIKTLEQYKLFDPSEKSAKIMYRQLNRRIKEVNKLADKITSLEFSLKTDILGQTMFINKLNKKSKEVNK